MPQNEFCGYENPAFQAQKVFNSPAHFCLKGNNLHNRRSRPADKDITTIAA
jgi:hypothetical protein